jgi:hypothetical protein
MVVAFILKGEMVLAIERLCLFPCPVLSLLPFFEKQRSFLMVSPCTCPSERFSMPANILQIATN